MSQPDERPADTTITETTSTETTSEEQPVSELHDNDPSSDPGTAADTLPAVGSTDTPEARPATDRSGPPPEVHPEHHTRRRYEVRHRTTYTYEEYVTESFGRALLAPRETVHQQVLEHRVEITPEPHILSEHVDHFGNRSSFYQVRTPHTVLDVHKVSTLEIEWPAPDVDRLDGWTVEQAAAAIAAGEGIDRAEAGVMVATFLGVILHDLTTGILIGMALTGFTVLAMLLVSGVFVLFGALAGMFALIIKLAPWLLVVLVVCWLLSNRRKQSNTYR